MKLSVLLLIVFLLSLGCEERINVVPGPCKFAPANSNFQVIDYNWHCDDCFVSIKMSDQEYYFEGNQVASGIDYPTGLEIEEYNYLRTGYENAFFSFILISPDKVEDFVNSLNIKTPLLDETSLLEPEPYELPFITASLEIKDYCRNRFGPITTSDVNQNYHVITSAQFDESFEYLYGNDNTDLHPYVESVFVCTGELKANYEINGKTELLTANYRLKFQILERQ